MALGRDRTPQSLQGFDPDFFGGGCSDGHLSSLLLNVDHWAYPSTSSVLSFGQLGDRTPSAKYPNDLHQEEECASWINTMGNHDPHGYPCMDSRQGGDHFRLLYPSVSGSGTGDCLHEGGQTERSQKRPYIMGGEGMQAAKNNKKAKAMPSAAAAAKDPQSIAAKNRRERISERLKVLQELVPNGTKVDLVTMLEKAISYVKFLQLQVKVLATDEFWPAQGGKAPEVTQVKEAIDAILSSHRGKN